jgi:hypothetical protein
MSLKIITEISLKNYFYLELDQLNKRSLCPVPQETIFYSSTILEKYSLAERLFEVRDGKVSEKILGQKLLAAGNLSQSEQKRQFKDIGDTALFICGYFKKSLSQKMVDISYYHKLGMTAYKNLNGVQYNHFEIPAFFDVLATCFENITVLMASLALNDLSDPHAHLLLDNAFNETLSEKEMLILGIQKPNKKAC